MNETMKIARLILPLALIAGGLLVGIIFDKIILKRLRKVAVKTKWEGDEIIVSALSRMTILWFVVAGIYGAANSIPMRPTHLSILHKTLLVIVIFSATVVLARISVGFVNLYAARVKGVLPSTSIFVNLTKLLVFLVGVLIILQTLGISVTPILTALGIGGLAVALALQDTLSNLFSGLHIIVSRQVRPGDYVRLDSGEEGYVADITWRNTTIRTLPNNMVVVPNSRMASSVVTNFFLPEKEMVFFIEVGVSYECDLDKAEQVTTEIAKEVMKEVSGGVPQFEPFIRYHSFGDYSVKFTVILRAREFTDQGLIKHEFIKRLHERYRKEGIQIPFPTRTLYMKGREE
ncbi:MAG: mechanosensitive ion channel family protein [Nitrospirota bacterium]